MTEEVKRRGRPAKQPEPVADQTDASTGTTGENPDEAAQEEPQTHKEMTFDEVMAWNRDNAEKLPPLQKKQLKKPRKMTRM